MIGNSSGFSFIDAEEKADSVSAQFTGDNVCGEGASCTVYRIRLDGQLVAVKRLRPERRADPVSLAAYRKEFRIGQKLKHDALPVYRELHETLDDVYIVMEYVDGVSAEDFVQSEEGKAYFSSAENFRRFFSEIVSVVGYLHRSGVVHCDLKPANIILRHSDRGVMLLDLDKAYSDTLDNTHGGTPNISDPLSNGEKPSARKDWSAIGRIFDILAEDVSDFPRRRFKRFRRECDQDDATSERLLQALRPRSHAAIWWVIGIVSACIIAFALTLSRPKLAQEEVAPDMTPVPSNDTVDTVDTIIQAPASARDTVVTIIPVPAPAQQSVTAAPKMPNIDFDAEMAEFIQYAQTSFNYLATGNLSDSEILNTMYDANRAYNSAYGQLVSSTKEKYPDVPGIDIELQVARASESSHASKLFQQLVQALTDTTTARHRELYDDLE